MKKLISLLLAITLVFSVAALLASCSEEQPEPELTALEKLFVADQTSDYDGVVFSAATEYSELEGVYYYSHTGSLVIHKNDAAEPGENKMVILNGKTGEIVYTLKMEAADSPVTTSASVKHASIAYFIVERQYNSETEKYTEAIYTALGAKITSREVDSGEQIKITYLHRGFEGYICNIDGKIYEMVDDVATYKLDLGFITIPEGDDIDVFTATHYYALYSSSIYVFDHAYNLVACYDMPASCTSFSGYVLSDGNVAIQYQQILPDDASEYDIYSGDTKYDLVTLILNIADGTTASVDFGYIIGYVINKATSPEMFGGYFKEDSAVNIASLAPINNKAVDQANYIVVNLGDDLSIIERIGEDIKNQYGLAQPIANDRYIATDKANNKYLINAKGEIIGNVSSASYDSELGLFLHEDKYYDLDLKEVFDEDDVDGSYHDSGNGFKVYKKEVEIGEGEFRTEYLLRRGITFTKLDIPEGASVDTYSCYISYEYTAEDGKEYRVFLNTKGEEIFTVDCSAENYAYHEAWLYNKTLVIRIVSVDEGGERSQRYYVAKS